MWRSWGRISDVFRASSAWPALHAESSAKTSSWHSDFLSSLFVLAARGILDPLTGALCQSAAVLVVIIKSARILRFGSEAIPGGRTRPDRAGASNERSLMAARSVGT
jgi:hypothetical protein